MKFNSSALQEIDAEAASFIAERLQKLDAISNDIKALEEKLRAAAVPFTFVFPCQRKEDLEEREEQIISIYYWHCLVWGKSENDEYRLLYNSYKSYELQCYAEHLELLHSKPLIESKIDTRLFFEDRLADFYKFIINALKYEKGKDMVVCDLISLSPF